MEQDVKYMEPDQSDPEGHGEITKHIVEDKEVLIEISFQLKGVACAKILWQLSFNQRTNMSLEYRKWGEAQAAWTENLASEEVKNAVFPRTQERTQCLTAATATEAWEGVFLGDTVNSGSQTFISVKN